MNIFLHKGGDQQVSIQGELILSGGTVIDPAENFHGLMDILIKNGQIEATHPGEKIEAGQVIDVTGCYVFPGLIDYHTHLFYGGTRIGVDPDTALLPQGVTTAVDQGSAGVSNLDLFFDTVVERNQTRIYCYLHVAPSGLESLPHNPEVVDPALYDLNASRTLFEKYAGKLLGLKIRQSREIVGDMGLAPLKATIRMAEKIGCRVVVHTTNPPGDVGEIADLLRPGDVFTHMYQGKGHSIVNADGKIDRRIYRARERGVIFDTADGRGHYAVEVIQRALANGFAPDIISTDLTSGNVYDQAVFGLPLIMSKYLTVGMSLDDVVKACTATPAKLIGMEGKLGTLAPGACADVAVFRLVERTATFVDFTGQSLICNQLLIPQLTVSNGKVVYRSLEL